LVIDILAVAVPVAVGVVVAMRRERDGGLVAPDVGAAARAGMDEAGPEPLPNAISQAPTVAPAVRHVGLGVSAATPLVLLTSHSR